jgi:hypothetical protein
MDEILQSRNIDPNRLSWCTGKTRHNCLKADCLHQLTELATYNLAFNIFQMTF